MIIAVLLVLSQPALPHALVNGDFEAPVNDPRGYGVRSFPGWSVLHARGYRVYVGSRGERYVGGPVRPGQIVSMRYIARSAPQRGSFTGISQGIDARPWRGSHVRVSVAADPGYSVGGWLELRAGNATARRGFDQARGWHRYAVDMRVPADASTLTITIGTDGSLEADDVRIERVR